MVNSTFNTNLLLYTTERTFTKRTGDVLALPLRTQVVHRVAHNAILSSFVGMLVALCVVQVSYSLFLHDLALTVTALP